MKLILNNNWDKPMEINDYSRNLLYVNNHNIMHFALELNDNTEQVIHTLLSFKDLVINHITIVSSDKEILYDFEIEQGILSSIIDKIIPVERRVIIASINFQSMTLGKV